MDPISILYARVGGEKIRELVGLFYSRVRKDDVIGVMYPPDDWEGAERRLSDFIIYRFGGPQDYLERRGHPRLRARHFPFAIGSKERDRWLQLMGEAVIEAGVEQEPAILMMEFFGSVADAMVNRPG